VPGAIPTAFPDFKVQNNVKGVSVMSHLKTEVELTPETSCSLYKVHVRQWTVFNVTSVPSACMSVCLPSKLICYL
jgi:preprotein translocase subunit SecB